MEYPIKAAATMQHGMQVCTLKLQYDVGPARCLTGEKFANMSGRGAGVAIYFWKG